MQLLLGFKMLTRGQCDIAVRSDDHCCCAEARSVKYSECVSVALVIQHAMRMRPFMLSVACPVVPYFTIF